MQAKFGAAPLQPEDSSLQQLVDSTAELCRDALAGAELAKIGAHLRAVLLTTDMRRALVRDLFEHGAFPEHLRAPLNWVREQADLPGAFGIERCLILEAAQDSLLGLHAVAVPAAVKVCICREFRFFAEPGSEWLFQFDPSRYPVRAYCGIALLERFPAGQMSWEVSGFPRSWLLRARPRHLPILLYRTMFGLKGFKPTFCTHISIVRSKVPALIEKASMISYWRLAQALALQPEIRGIATSSWLYAPEMQEISPHLAWIRRLIVENGGAVADIGEAPPDSGFLEGSSVRRSLYESGRFKPREYAAVWPRGAVLRWAARHPEYNVEP